MERRRHIRVRPAFEAPLHVHLIGDAEPAALQAVDISLGGLACQTSGALHDVRVDQVLLLRLDFGRLGEFELYARIKHGSGANPGLTGMEFEGMSDEARTALRRYVAEMLERGQAV